MEFLQLVRRIFLNKLSFILILMSLWNVPVSAQIEYLEQYKIILEDILKSGINDTVFYIAGDSCMESLAKSISIEKVKYGLPNKDKDVYVLNYPIKKRNRLFFCVVNSFCDTKKKLIITGGFTYYVFDKKRPRCIIAKKNDTI